VYKLQLTITMVHVKNEEERRSSAPPILKPSQRRKIGANYIVFNFDLYSMKIANIFCAC
jgi:hypothetical protein